MDYRELREKTDRYWLGETTLEEERQLKAFFAQHTGPLPEDLQQAALLLGFYQAEAQQPVPVLGIPGSAGKMASRRLAKNRTWTRYWELAAVLLVLLGSLWMLKPGRPHAIRNAAIADTYQDPQEALQVTRKALEVVAANLNKGKVQMQKLGVFNEIEQKIDGTVK